MPTPSPVISFLIFDVKRQYGFKVQVVPMIMCYKQIE